ncbi:4-hydroxybenzoate octaprenyltransferase [Methylophilus medardicus]|uniref:4-hydroxybenzoate octaprenyltransferase n=1 Tax=Methylophilus medardicus TaxID=2588534 RepID=A0A5B8CV05_9PROT|nr:4-hydroxybenzoate octaprenyltransferase [Methylophilus medardicus]QDC45089.1 4-hydroxybenzoate octaprenyltransferase [Methylophilus medardicus]QDC50096.1 4-hydroxybenzoate octaprenyltransferase [Methylophilus medardicus]QDC53801.1 4-hydroxybenzoate octaprenyltransferase [Methylophilus medardicus]
MPSLAKWHAYYRLTRLDKPVGIWLLLWPTLWGLLIAGKGFPQPWVVCVFVLGTILMRSAGCALNDIADRHWDGAVARTKLRPLATGEISVREAYGVALGLSVLAFVLVCTLGWQVVVWSFPALFLAVSYPYTKRFFAIPQAYLGIAFGFGIPMTFVALQGQVPALAWWLLAANVCWSVAYDTAYAMVDRADDLQIGIRSSAITFGRFDVFAIMLCFAAMMLILAGVAHALMLGWPFWLGWTLAVIQLCRQYALIRHRQPADCFKAFLENVWIGAAITIGIAVSYCLGRFA